MTPTNPMQSSSDSRAPTVKVLALAGGLAALIVLSLLAYSFWPAINPPPAAEPVALRGVHYNPPRPAHDIRAIDHNGKPFVLSRQPHPLMMIFFGYVSCTDVCPTNLKKMEIIQQKLGAQADQVQFVFVSVAPEHERPADMKEYLDQYAGEIIGVTGKTADSLDETYRDWGIVREKQELDTPVLGRNYRYDHTAQIFLVQNGVEMPVSYPYGTGTDVMLEDVRNLLADPTLGAKLPAVGRVKEVAIAPGTFTRAAQDNPTLPAYLRLHVGDTIRWKNDDYMYHFIGDISLAPGESATQTFDEVGTFYYGCTAVPSEVIRINVSPGPKSADAESTASGPSASL